MRYRTCWLSGQCRVFDDGRSCTWIKIYTESMYYWMSWIDFSRNSTSGLHAIQACWRNLVLAERCPWFHISGPHPQSPMLNARVELNMRGKLSHPVILTGMAIVMNTCAPRKARA